MFDFLKQKAVKKPPVQFKESEPICPYCKTLLDKPPKRKKKCPFCEKDIYVRTTQNLFSSSYLTKDEVIALDGFKRLEEYGINEQCFFDKNEYLSNKFGFANPKDVVWKLYNDENMKAIKAGDMQILKTLNFNMALFLKDEGRDFFGCLQESSKMELMLYKQRGCEKVQILSVGGCEACTKLNDLILPIDEALEKMPIPVKECTFKLHDNTSGWCRCIYVAYFDDL